MKTLNEDQIDNLLEILRQIADNVAQDLDSRKDNPEYWPHQFNDNREDYKARLTDLFGTKD